MKVVINKGTKQIGGCITEILSNNARIIIDFGEDLPDDNKECFDVSIDGVTNDKNNLCDAVFITHNHGDHIGLINKIHNDVLVYVEEKAYEVYKVSQAFMCDKKIRNVKTFKFEEKILIKDMVITPYKTDHSSYNSCMFLVESNLVRILHMGDYRANGYSSVDFYDNLKKIKSNGDIDLLITEGTSVNRSENENITERNLREKAVDIFKKYKQVFIYQASTNVDRIKTFYDAACDCNKKFILDVSSANVLKTINDKDFDYLTKNNVSVWIANAYDKNSKLYDYKEEGFYEKYIEPFMNLKNTYALHESYVMMVKSSMISDITNNLSKYRDDACFIYSLWKGYLNPDKVENKKNIEFVKKVEELGIKQFYLHTSGHADIPTMLKVNDIIKPKKVIGIHTVDNEKLGAIFSNYVKIEDGEIICIGEDE